MFFTSASFTEQQRITAWSKMFVKILEEVLRGGDSRVEPTDLQVKLLNMFLTDDSLLLSLMSDIAATY